MEAACSRDVILLVVVLLLIGLARISDLESGLDRHTHAEYETLLDWIQNLGGGMHGASPQPVPGMGTGVVASMDLQEGTIVSRTPLSAVINIEHALVSEHFGPLADQLDYLSSTNLKALFVAYERQRGDSFWQPFLDTVPSHIPTTLFFSDGDLAELQSSLVKDFAMKQKSAARKAFEGVHSGMESLLPDFKEEHFYWGIATWSSRAHRIRVRDHDEQWQRASCLVPLADLFNMAVREKSSNVKCATNHASTHFECYTIRPVSAGTQLLVEYVTEPDMRHNGRLLMHFGFVARGNPYDSVSIKSVKLSPELPYYSTRSELARRLHSVHQEFFQLSRPTASDPTVVELVKMMRLTVGTVSEIKKAAKLPQPFSEALGPKSEKRALRQSLNYLWEILDMYGTTAKEDEELLVNEQLLSVNRKHTVVLRLEEKLIIHDNVAFIEQQLASISRERTEL